MNKRQERYQRLKMRRFYLFLLLCVMGGISCLIYQKKTAERLRTLSMRQERIAEARRQELEIVNMIKKGLRPPLAPPVRHVTIGGKTTAESFSKLTIRKKESITPLALPLCETVAGESAAWVKQNMAWDQNDHVVFPYMQDSHKLRQYALYRLARCNELISWTWADPRNYLPGRQNTIIHEIRKLSVPHLFHLDPGLLSFFRRAKDIENNKGMRARIPVIYTDLARMLIVYQNTDAGNPDAMGSQLYVGVQAGTTRTQLLTGAMAEAYLSARELVRQVKKEANNSPYDIALRLHDALCYTLTYTNEMHAANNENLVVNALLYKRAASYGYARTYMLLLTMAGINNVLVSGTYTYGNTTVPREWNLVELEPGRWAYIDVAADDQAVIPSGRSSQEHIEKMMAQAPSHSYFGLSDEALRKTHKITTRPPGLPPASDPQLYYFNHQKWVVQGKNHSIPPSFTKSDDLLDVLNQHAKKGKILECHLVNPMILQTIQAKLADYDLHIIASEPDIHNTLMIYIK